MEPIGQAGMKRFAITAVVATTFGLWGLLSLAQPAYGVFVQTIGTKQDSTGVAGTTLVIPVGAAVTAGHSIIVAMVTNGDVTVPSCSDTKGNTYPAAGDVTNFDPTLNIRVYVCSAHNVTALTVADTITVTFASLTGGRAASAFEFSGLNGIVDKIASAHGSGTAASSGLTAATTSPNTLLFGAIAVNGPVADTFTPGTDMAGGLGTPYTLPPGGEAGNTASPFDRTINPEYQFVSATGTYEADGTLGTPRAWAAALVAYQVPTCGDGFIQTLDGEQCDQGANNGTAGSCCDATCMLRPTTYVCRAPAGVCDQAESCNGVNGACPADAKMPVGTICRPAAPGVPPAATCDVAETCDGVTNACPPDGFVSPLNYALGEPTFQSSNCGADDGCPTLADIVSGKAVDGNTDGNFANMSVAITDEEDADQPEPYWQVDIGSVNMIGAIEVWNRTDAGAGTRLNNYHVFVSDVAFTGTTVAASMGQAGVSDYFFAVAPSPTQVIEVNRTGEFVRVQLTAASATANGAGEGGGNYLQLAEVRVLAPSPCRPAVAGGCDIAENCTGSSATCPVDTIQPAATVCRPAAPATPPTLTCDVAETCTGASNMCPADAVLPNTTVCRPAVPGSGGATTCDIAENCNGTTNTCPADAVQPSGTLCRMGSGDPNLSGFVCDPTENCTGSSNTCPADTKSPMGTVCRAQVPGSGTASSCDVAETCSGMAMDPCPVDAFVTVGTVCRTGSGSPNGGTVCDPNEACTGTGPTCPADVVSPSTTVCRPAVPGVGASTCDVAENCPGTATNPCPVDSFVASTVVCRPTAGVCDVAEKCTGTGNTCPADAVQPSTFVCRPSAGECDVDDKCNGTLVTCTADAKKPASTPCTADTDPCTPDVCNGSSNACTHVPSPDTDGDGVCDLVENSGPNSGDYDNDGDMDSMDCTVATLPTATGFGFETIVLDTTASPGCACLNKVKAYTEAQLGTDVPYEYPFGLLGFTVVGPGAPPAPTCPKAKITVYYHDGENQVIDAYRKYGPTTPGVPSTTKFYTLPGVMFDTGNFTTGSEDPVLRAMFTLNDGQLGDATGVDGQIVDPGGPAVADLRKEAPVVSPRGLAGMVLLLSFVAVYGIWRSRLSERRQ